MFSKKAIEPMKGHFLRDCTVRSEALALLGEIPCTVMFPSTRWGRWVGLFLMLNSSCLRFF